MDFFEPSSNNLYKFMAIIGFILLIAPSVLPDKQLELDLSIVELEHAIGDINRRIDFQIIVIAKMKIRDVVMLESLQGQSQESQDLKKSIEELIKKLKEGFVENEMRNEIQNEIDQISIVLDESFQDVSVPAESILSNKRERDTAIQESDEITELLIQAETAYKSIEITSEHIIRERWKNTVSRVLGLMLLIFGLAAWYIHIQQYVDKDIKTIAKN